MDKKLVLIINKLQIVTDFINELETDDKKFYVSAIDNAKRALLNILHK